MRSVRLRFISRLQCVGDHISKQLVKVLGGPKVHAQPAGNMSHRLIICVPNDASKGQGDNTHVLPGLHEQVHKVDWSPVIPDFQKLVSVGKLSPATNHDLIFHQRPQFGKIFDVVNLIPKAAGVES